MDRSSSHSWCHVSQLPCSLPTSSSWLLTAHPVTHQVERVTLAPDTTLGSSYPGTEQPHCPSDIKPDPGPILLISWFSHLLPLGGQLSHHRLQSWSSPSPPSSSFLFLSSVFVYYRAHRCCPPLAPTNPKIPSPKKKKKRKKPKPG